MFASMTALTVMEKKKTLLLPSAINFQLSEIQKGVVLQHYHSLDVVSILYSSLGRSYVHTAKVLTVFYHFTVNVALRNSVICL